ncbi:MAG: hypothetical protein DRJ03_07665 [Chloroflexi bacterium]|nr:MAG: hypothetical protein DRJ03_07665 [Chloroflexota bacterium]
MSAITNEQVAELLEKSAAYIENLVATQAQSAQEERIKEASDLAQQISDATGDEIDSDTVAKIAEVAPEVSDILRKFAGTSSQVDSLGGPETDSDNVKVAHSMSSADRSFLGWLTS